jgi:hypothetical protein
MSRLALLAAAILAVAAPSAAHAEPLDIDLSRLGPPEPSVWGTFNPGGSAAFNAQLAKESRQRFAILSGELGLALSSAILHPASTTGYSGFAVDLEVATMAVHPDPVGVATAGYSNRPWAGASELPTQLFMPSVHVRKGLPFSFEIGGRFIYLAMSNAFAGQGEAKWAINEGFEYIPDVALRGAYTRLFGVKDFNLATTDVDLLVSKRFGLMGVTSLTPYVAARYTWLYASSDQIDFAAGSGAAPIAPTDLGGTASFPKFRTRFFRTTAGLRFTAYSVSMAVEGTYFGGATASTNEYPDVKLKRTLGGAAKLGWEW